MERNRTESGVRPLRRDAENNRQLIISAAAAVFASRGQNVDVREIARCAGIGMGTLYRHFPTKELLIQTVMHQAFQDWMHTATDAAQREPDSWRALQGFIYDAVARQAEHRALMETLTMSVDGDSAITDCANQILPVVRRMVEGAHLSGALRSDVSEIDILALVIALGRITDLQSEALPVQWEKYVSIVIDGLRAR